jgi:hypothetical protein
VQLGGDWAGLAYGLTCLLSALARAIKRISASALSHWRPILFVRALSCRFV